MRKKKKKDYSDFREFDDLSINFYRSKNQVSTHLYSSLKNIVMSWNTKYIYIYLYIISFKLCTLFDYYFFLSRSYTYTREKVVNYKLVRYSCDFINHLSSLVNNHRCHLSFRYSNGIKHDHISKCETRTRDNRQYC